jgi:hypothetical protein
MCYCFIRDFPNLEGQVPVVLSRRNRLTQLYPQALGLRSETVTSQSKLALSYYRWSARQTVLVSDHHLGYAHDQFFFDFHGNYLKIFRFFIMGRPPWRKDGCILFIAVSLQPEPLRLIAVLYCLIWDWGPCIYIPQEQVGPGIPPGTGLTLPAYNCSSRTAQRILLIVASYGNHLNRTENDEAQGAHQTNATQLFNIFLRYD